MPNYLILPPNRDHATPEMTQGFSQSTFQRPSKRPINETTLPPRLPQSEDMYDFKQPSLAPSHFRDGVQLLSPHRRF